MLTTRDKFIELAGKIVSNHGVYIWGAQGQRVNKLTPSDIRSMETSIDNATAVLDLINAYDRLGYVDNKCKAFDCSGLVCYLLTKIGREPAGFDMTADGLAQRYKSRSQAVPGCLLHRKGHIAIYIGDNHLIEAKGRKWGVVVSPFVPNEWDKSYPDPFME